MADPYDVHAKLYYTVQLSAPHARLSGF